MTWERDREQGYDAQYARQEATAFRSAAHRNRMLARWAAELMGLRHRGADSYADALVTGDVAHLRGRAVVAKIASDLRAAGVAIPQAQIEAMFDHLDARARAEIATE